jgi:hypothetical protein
MKFDAAAVRKCLKSFDFNTLFREHLGWDKHQAQLDIPVDGSVVRLTAIAHKRGFTAYVCESIPDRPTRLKIDHQVTKSAREHFIIYADQDAGQQVWQWVRREPGKPLASRDHRFDVSTTGDALIQRLDQIAVSLAEEESLTVVDVAARARAAFDVDQVTKKFYDRFKAEHAAFLKFIKGIQSQADLEWYTSLMLNRLMFVYFIQKKGFLDGDTNYLQNRMRRVREIKGKDKFQSFYRYFLIRLFHDGLGKHETDRKLDRDFEKLLGKVPYLNGGFFEVHQLEERYTEIDIPDKAFEKLFAFFDEFSWHLDERPLRAGNEINPDVVGYIFEKYINQKQMGAYYTKEDITEYISKNTIIPFLFDAAQKKCPVAFQPDSFLWRLLRDDPDRYIYAAVRHGVVRGDGSIVSETELPDFVQKGLHDVAARMHDKRFNLEQAPKGDPIRLPTETWREYMHRRQRCLELRDKLRKGEVHQINDLITLNLDIWQFARDAIVNSEGPELLRAFWHAIVGRIPEKSNEKLELGLSVLDPTCGSGAFLFAALRILETLYSDCLERMERFVEDHDSRAAPSGRGAGGVGANLQKFSDFRTVLAEIQKHPNQRYFILKSIIIHNLFGVDIMEEAVEICKLRLFLKLVAQVESVDQIEPLPDIDFNIRAGNTLVGYVSLDDIRRSQAGRLGFGASEVQRIEEEALAVEKCFEQFRAQQTKHGGKVTAKDKQELRRRLQKLDAELDRYLAGEYAIAADNFKTKTAYEEAFAKWKTSHQPFHWLAQFYGIMRNGGFDVIIGNPPYVEYRKVRAQYTIIPKLYKTTSAENLYAFCVERSGVLQSPDGRFGMIVPSSAVGLDETACLRKCLADRYNLLWYSTYSIRPAKLFDGVDQRLCIAITAPSSGGNTILHTTAYRHWAAEERLALFPTLRYSDSFVHKRLNRIAQVGSSLARSVLDRIEMKADKEVRSFYATGNRGFTFHYHRSPRYWIRSMDFEQYFKSDTRSRSVHHFRNLLFVNEASGKCACAVVNSSLYFFWFMSICNGRNLTSTDVERFPIGTIEAANSQNLITLFDRLMRDYKKHSFVRKRADCEYQEFRPSESKDIIDEIDSVLAQHYGFTDEELDFIINYDIKYRMGQDSGDEGDE